jgi:hypothetical protein
MIYKFSSSGSFSVAAFAGGCCSRMLLRDATPQRRVWYACPLYGLFSNFSSMNTHRNPYLHRKCLSIGIIRNAAGY